MLTPLKYFISIVSLTLGSVPVEAPVNVTTSVVPLYEKSPLSRYVPLI
jgi:hypothetical protein